MYYVYLIKSFKNESIYIGYTEDLKKRLKLHSEGEVDSTKLGKPWELIYYEAYKIKQDGRSRTWLKKRLQESLKKGVAQEV